LFAAGQSRRLPTHAVTVSGDRAGMLLANGSTIYNCNVPNGINGENTGTGPPTTQAPRIASAENETRLQPYCRCCSLHR